MSAERENDLSVLLHSGMRFEHRGRPPGADVAAAGTLAGAPRAIVRVADFTSRRSVQGAPTRMTGGDA